MTRTVKIVLNEAEYQQIQRAAANAGISISQWVQQAIASSLSSESQESIGRKLEAIRAAVKHSFPTADISVMLAEIAGRQPNKN